MSIKALLANSHNQLLTDHLKAVAIVSKSLAKHLKAPDDVQKIAYYAGLLHDIAKAPYSFQKILNKSNISVTVEEQESSFGGPYHNEIGYAVLKESEGGRQLLEKIFPSDLGKPRDILAASVLWHHACRHSDSSTYSISVEDVDAAAILSVVQSVIPNFEDADFSVDSANESFTNEFSLGGPKGAKEKIVRSCLIAADHTVSMLDASICSAIACGNIDLNSINAIQSLFADNIAKVDVSFPDPISERDHYQAECVAAEGNLIQVNAPTGFGKTRIGIRRMLHRGRKTIWVCPRNTVAESVYANIVDEMAELDVNLSAELFITNRRQKSTKTAPPVPVDKKEPSKNAHNFGFTADIVVCNIDMLLKPQTDYRLQDRLYLALSYDIVFDEFHEFAMKNSPLFAAFIDLVKARKYCLVSSTICLSATPTNILELALPSSEIIYLPKKGQHYPSIHKKDYILKLVRTDNSDDFPKCEIGSMVMFNAIKNAQLHCMKHHNRILIHSKFTENDKHLRMNALIEAYGKHGNGIEQGKYVITAPILQAALNISFSAVYISSGGAEMDLQAARTNRFGEMDDGYISFYDMHKNNAERAAVNARWDSGLQQMWFDHLVTTFGIISVIKLDDLYGAYNAFYEKYGENIKVKLKSWLDYGLSYMPNLAPRRFETVSRSNGVRSTGATLRNPDGSYRYRVMDINGISWPDDAVFSCDSQELENIAKGEEWLTNRVKLERLAVQLGIKYKCLYKLPQGKNRLEFARNMDTPFPATELRYDPDDGVIYGNVANFVVG